MNEEILYGLKTALERGNSLEKAMMTFFNAGYKKEEIEEAARAVVSQTPEVSATPSSPAVIMPKTSKEEKKEKKLKVKKNVPQKVSGYGEKNTTNRVIIFILIFMLIFLFGALVAIFIFKDELINFFSSLFS